MLLSFDANVSSCSLAESPPHDLQITAYKWWFAHAQCHSTVLAANTILLMHKWNHAFLLLAIALAWDGRSLRFPKIFLKKQTRGSKDKTFTELGYRKISWFVSVSQINYLRSRIIIDLLATDKSRYFAQPHPIIANH